MSLFSQISLRLHIISVCRAASSHNFCPANNPGNLLELFTSMGIRQDGQINTGNVDMQRSSICFVLSHNNKQIRLTFDFDEYGPKKWHSI